MLAVMVCCRMGEIFDISENGSSKMKAFDVALFDEYNVINVVDIQSNLSYADPVPSSLLQATTRRFLSWVSFYHNLSFQSSLLS